MLFVSGKPTLGKELASSLDRASFSTSDVSDFSEAMLMVGKQRPDIVVMNTELSFIDGWEACHWLHRTFGTPVILVGRENAVHAWPRAVQAGADCYLAAPFSDLELAARVKSILRRYDENGGG